MHNTIFNVKINNYTEYLEINDVSKEKISEVVKEVLSLLKTLANSSVIDYEEEKKIVENADMRCKKHQMN